MKKLIVLLFIFFIIINNAAAQNYEDEAQVDSLKSLSPVSALWRSAIMPGWGQIYQERLLPAAVLYSSSAVFLYRSFFHLYHYDKGKNKEHYNLFRTNMSIAAYFYVLNLVDAADAAYRLKPAGWQGSLLGDKPLKSPWGAALRSAILPGWGQVYNESYLKAVGYIAVDGYLFYKIRRADIRYRQSGDTKYRDDRSKYSWYFGLAYFITIADAYAGAYLYKFDEAVELAFVPEIVYDGIGIGLYVKF